MLQLVLIFGLLFSFLQMSAQQTKLLKKEHETPLDTVRAKNILKKIYDAYENDGFSDFLDDMCELKMKYYLDKIDSVEYYKNRAKFDQIIECKDAPELGKLLLSWKEEFEPQEKSYEDNQLLKSFHDLHNYIFRFDSFNPSDQFRYEEFLNAEYLLVPTKINIYLETGEIIQGEGDSKGVNYFGEIMRPNGFDSTEMIGILNWDKKIKEDYVIEGFQPSCDFDFAEILYLTPEYEYAFNTFLSRAEISKYCDNRGCGIWSGIESNNRMKYLGNFLVCVESYHSLNSYIGIYPGIQYIIFSPNGKQAIVSLGNHDGSRSILYKIENGKWEFVEILAHFFY